MEIVGPSICGIDEAGRGALAGPLVAAAIRTPYSIDVVAKTAHTPVRDSKTLSEAQRNRVFDAMLLLKINIRVVIISVPEINAKGISWANTISISRLIESIDAETFIVDGNMNFRTHTKHQLIQSIIDADATIDSVILAGIAAKVTRDSLMYDIHAEYPTYGWDHNKGYGTKMHEEAIRAYGTCPYHRTLFVKKIVLP